jgi:hypothetical protein
MYILDLKDELLTIECLTLVSTPLPSGATRILLSDQLIPQSCLAIRNLHSIIDRPLDRDEDVD